jgi:hypothetical protein
MPRTLGLLLLLLTLSATPVGQDLPKARSLAQQILDALEPTPVAVVIPTPAAFNVAYAAAPAGATLTLSRSLVYTDPLVLNKAITLRPEGDLPLTPMDATTLLPSFRDGITISGDAVTVIGVEAKKVDPQTDIVVVSGAGVTLDRIRVLGDPVKGAKRGIRANSNGNLRILRYYIDYTFQILNSADSQAICGWDMGPGLLIEDGYASGGSESIMIGGGDPASAARMPDGVTIRHNRITKRPEWQTMLVGVKNILEIKAGRNILIEDNDLSYSWGGHGQDGYAFLVTVRNQDGRAPWSTVQNVVFRGTRITHAAAAINILGLDNIREDTAGRPTPVGSVRPSIRASTISITGNTATDLDPTKWTGSNRMILIGGSPIDVTIDMNTFVGQHLGSVVYLYGSLPTSQIPGLMITNNTWPPSTYGVKGDGLASGTATWAAYVLSGRLEGNVIQ